MELLSRKLLNGNLYVFKKSLSIFINKFSCQCGWFDNRIHRYFHKGMGMHIIPQTKKPTNVGICGQISPPCRAITLLGKYSTFKSREYGDEITR